MIDNKRNFQKRRFQCQCLKYLTGISRIKGIISCNLRDDSGCSFFYQGILDEKGKENRQGGNGDRGGPKAAFG